VRHVAALDDGLDRHIAEQAEFVAQIGIEGVIAAADQHVGLNADLAQFGHRLLGGFALEFAGRGQVGHQRDVDEDHVGGACFVGKLPHGFQEGQALDIAGGAADFGDQHVDIFAAGRDPILDLVGDMGDHLDGLAEVIAAAFPLDHAFVNLARTQAVEPGKLAAGETFVVAEIEVGFGPVFQDVHFAVLERAHRTRIHVQIGVELLDADLQAAHLQQRAERRCRQPFA